MTRWPEYLRGHHLPSAAALVALPQIESEPALVALCSSLNRIVEEAYHSVCCDQINPFEQARINSFLQRPSAADRPLMVKLKKSTWRQYVRVWEALLCFTYRTAQRGCRVELRHQLTNRQVVQLDDAVTRAEELLRLSVSDLDRGDEATALLQGATNSLDSSCLELCMSLLDHDLKGDLFESIIIGFLAVLGIDVEKGILKEAYHYLGPVRVHQGRADASDPEGRR
ncbi:hypothetical protein LTR37_021409, partial [Vermiconidia calcicola]